MEYYTFIDGENYEVGFVMRDPGVKLTYIRFEKDMDRDGFFLGEFDSIQTTTKKNDEHNVFDDMEDEILANETEYGVFKRLEDKNQFFKLIFGGQ